jgi:hypothetical protein
VDFFNRLPFPFPNVLSSAVTTQEVTDGVLVVTTKLPAEVVIKTEKFDTPKLTALKAVQQALIDKATDEIKRLDSLQTLISEQAVTHSEV